MTRDIAEIMDVLDLTAWPRPDGAAFHHNRQRQAIEALEAGKVVFLPRLAFALSEREQTFLDPATVSPSAKNVSFDHKTDQSKHAMGDTAVVADVTAMLRRYSEQARALVCALFPHYEAALEWGRTSFRPVEIEGRKASVSKDDTLLHVDAFPTSPTGKKRILRVFTNVNPAGKTRHWRLGEPFENVARKFLPKAKAEAPGSAYLLHLVGLTKTRRTSYDHFMLNIHDTMKRDPDYQRTVTQNEFFFPPGSTWIVFTDCTSHAAMSGQHMFEQTFYLPVSAMADETKSPQRVLERLAGRALI